VAVVVNALIADPAANSYCDIAWADAYNANHPFGTAWAALSADTKGQLLILATALIDEYMDWFGFAAGPTQRLSWPRFNVYDQKGYPIQPSVIPDLLKDAVAEFARQLNGNDRTVDNDIETQGIERLSISGAVDITFKQGVHAKVLPDAVFQKITRWGTLRTRTGMVKLIRA